MRRKSSTHNVFNTIGASNHTTKERSNNDFYATAPLAVKKLLELETFSQNIWEPACGMNHITNELRNKGYTVKTSDIIDMIGDGSVIIQDFLLNTEVHDCDIITNPHINMQLNLLRRQLNQLQMGTKLLCF